MIIDYIKTIFFLAVLLVPIGVFYTILLLLISDKLFDIYKKISTKIYYLKRDLENFKNYKREKEKINNEQRRKFIWN